MDLVRRTDRAQLSGVVRTPSGGFRAQAALTRTGILEYMNPDGSIRREYRPPVEVGSEVALQSLQDAPITLLHPEHGAVTPETYQQDAVGHVASVPRLDGDLVVADVVVNAARAIEAVEGDGIRELSCGYVCRIDFTPGTTPEGERYDAVQRGFRYNHVALVPRGRAGENVALRLDSQGHQIPEGEKHTMPDKTETVYEKIGNDKYEVGTDAHLEAVKRQDAADHEKAQDLAALKAENASLKTKNKSLQERLDAMPEEVEAAVGARVTLLQHADKHGVEVRADMNDKAISLALLKHLAPDLELRTDEKDDPAILGASLRAVLNQAPGRTQAKAAASLRSPGEPAKREDSAAEALTDPYAAAARKSAERSAGLLKAANDQFRKDYR